MMRGRAATITGAMAEEYAWMVGLQLGMAALFVLLAVRQLRPTFRRHEATQPRRKWFAGKKAKKARPPRWYDRPACGLDAMGWKERHFARTDVFTKMVVLPATVAVSVLLVLFVGIDESIWNAFAELWNRGLRDWGGGGETLARHIRLVTAWYVAIWLLAVAGASSSSVAVEREEDTWISLTSTPLTGWEIVRGKAFGALWAQRGFGVVPLALWVVRRPDSDPSIRSAPWPPWSRSPWSPGWSSAVGDPRLAPGDHHIEGDRLDPRARCSVLYGYPVLLHPIGILVHDILGVMGLATRRSSACRRGSWLRRWLPARRLSHLVWSTGSWPG